MKKFSVLAILAFVTMGVSFTSCDSKKSRKSVKLTSEIDSASYIIGKANMYSLIKQNQLQMDNWPDKANYDAFIAGLYDGLDNPDDSLFLGKDMAGVNEFISLFYTKLQQKLSDNQKKEGDIFLAENKNKSGVVTTGTGLQYKVITEGTGVKPKEGDIVKIHYVGKYLDGTEFDNSISRGEPSDFQISSENNFMMGWVEGLQLMAVGSKYIFWVPAVLAFGEQGSQIIKPNSTLEFEVELLDIVKQ